MYVCMYACLHTQIELYLSIYLSIYIYIYKNRERESERWREIEMAIQIDRCTYHIMRCWAVGYHEFCIGFTAHSPTILATGLFGG